MSRISELEKKVERINNRVHKEERLTERICNVLSRKKVYQVVYSDSSIESVEAHDYSVLGAGIQFYIHTMDGYTCIKMVSGYKSVEEVADEQD